MKQNLDEAQQKAVTHGEGPLLVTAGPGSGKTTVITHHIKYLIDNLGVSPKEILVITFTKSAAVEMKERFLRLSEERNTQVAFGTFHAFFYQILRQSGGFNHNSILKEKEKFALLRDILKAQKIYFYENTFLEDLLGEISQVNNKNNLEDYESGILDKKEFYSVYKEYHRRKEAIDKIDFDDMITRCYELLSENSTILRRWQESFRFILVDEFQDINPMQYEIVKMLAERHHNIFAVGDEDQSIYSFRGTNPKICFQFLKDYPEAKQLFLTVNYRCHEDIVEASKKLISHNKNRFHKEIRAIKDIITDDSGLTVNNFNYEQEEYESIVKKLKEYMKEGKLNQCVILFRTNMISPLFFTELKKYRIPYRLKNTCRDWRENTVVKDILAYFSLAEGDLNRKHFFRIMNKPVRYISRDMITEDRMTWDTLEKNGKAYFSVLENIQKLRRDLSYIQKLPVFAALGYIRRAMGYEKWLKEQGGKIYQDGMEVLETLRILARECDTTDELKEILKTACGAEELNHEEEAVDIMTYHGAKGLEWPVVFLPDVVEGITPYKRAQSNDELEEERRMFYVALTRAKNKVHIYSLFKDEKHKKSPSIFIKELKGE